MNLFPSIAISFLSFTTNVVGISHTQSKAKPFLQPLRENTKCKKVRMKRDRVSWKEPQCHGFASKKYNRWNILYRSSPSGIYGGDFSQIKFENKNKCTVVYFIGPCAQLYCSSEMSSSLQINNAQIFV